ncbi:hypothetical protein BCR36DRAFT_416404 [Piromyces finnis]|uniref:Calcineurin-like phosphoesterase domain-containing protein n=1 Tax=Piromyces finnis TaxID=1754191 RepID=A0A1Y1UWJ8_9FUNG|nr:hypothetical protein BCR36DRAFT_416404 [Piromyces finnis]|eukprot:ORX42002.1 hypothetical protein BCR36DRAFT_416404 [Piromyces finnis]
MRLNIKPLLSLLLLVFHQTNKVYSEEVITDDKLNSFSYGAQEFRLAIIGDSGVTSEARDVMKLSDFDALLHLGDFDYEKYPTRYLKSILDSDRKYQFLGVIGNHDTTPECSQSEFSAFKSGLYNEMTGSKNSKVSCEFSSSKCMWSCKYMNMRIIGLTPNINNCDDRKEQLSFLKSHLQNAEEDWKVCAWHYYDRYYHTGKYQDHTFNVVSKNGESFYDYCKDHGAIIFSAHDHVYARTKVMSKFLTPEIDSYDKDSSGDIIQIRNGATFNILNGAGGWEMYIEQGEQKNYSHWQKKYAKGSNNEYEKAYGALFCNFNVGGNNRKAYCEFQRINTSKKVFDTFTLYRNDNPGEVKYTQIDENFKNEKLKAYKVANNISDNDAIDKTLNISKDNDSNYLFPNSKIVPEKVKPFLTKRNVIIGGSICAALVLFGCGFLLFRRKGGEDSDSKVKSSNNKDESFSFSGMPDTNNYNTNNDTIRRHGTIDDSFAPLPISLGNDFYENKEFKIFYSNSKATTPKLENDNGKENLSEYPYYRNELNTRSSTIDIEPLVSYQQKIENRNYNNSMDEDDYNNNNKYYNTNDVNHRRPYDDDRNDDYRRRPYDDNRNDDYHRRSYNKDEDNRRYSRGGRYSQSPRRNRSSSRESRREDNYSKSAANKYNYSGRDEEDTNVSPRITNRYKISQKHEPTNNSNVAVKSILKNKNYPYTVNSPIDGTTTTTTIKDQSRNQFYEGSNSRSRNDNYVSQKKIDYDTRDNRYYKYR